MTSSKINSLKSSDDPAQTPNGERTNAVFITGATGFVGSHLARRLLADGYRVEALTRTPGQFGLLTNIADQIIWHIGDVTDIPSLETAIGANRPTALLDVIHAAAVVSFSPKDRPAMEKINVEGTANVVNVCLMASVHKLGFVSSVAALGRPNPIQKNPMPGQPTVIDERQKWEESPENSFYAQTKYRAELEVWRGVAEGLNVVIVNPSIVLGVGDWSRTSTQLVKYVLDEKRFYPNGLINYVDVLDVAETLVRLMQADVSAERFILNSGTMPYRDFFEKLALALGKRPPSIAVPNWLTQVLWPIEAVRSAITGSSPLITRETARSARSLYQMNGEKITQTLDFQYHSLAETVARVAIAVKHG
jgi:dihydroflavonol-4-reductase